MRRSRSKCGEKSWARVLPQSALLLLMLVLTPWQVALGETTFITMASTTSTENSGLLDFLLPIYEAKSGVEVRVLAVGTGQALRLGERGDVDVVLVHDRHSEDRFMEAGHGEERRDIMYNDFVLIGPETDPAAVQGSANAAEALRRIHASTATFLSRGDDSGTHKAEMRLWEAAGVDPRPASGTWYREVGSGMGATLNAAAASEAYTLSDRGTWLSFGNRRGLQIVHEGDPPMRNPYGAMVVSATRHPHVKSEAARDFVAWLASAEAQAAIADFRVDGQILFYPTP